MAKRTCTIDGCDKPHGARGMCYSHYGTWHRRTHGRKSNQDTFTITCHGCGESAQSSRPEGKYCSELCYHFDNWGPRTCAWPKPEPAAQAPKQPSYCADHECAWCGERFTTSRRSQTYCCFNHKRKAQIVRRRGREHGSTSHYTWAEFIGVFLAHDRRCAYCEQVVEGQPDPDHVHPLSKGGSNSITNILPSCRLCNSDKRDLLLDEWAADRERRGLEPRVTTWAIDDPRVRHLTSLAAA